MCRFPPSPPPFHAHLADEGGIGEGGPDIRVLVELVVLGQLWGRQAEGNVATGEAQLGEKCPSYSPYLRRWGSRTCHCSSAGRGPRHEGRQNPGLEALGG